MSFAVNTARVAQSSMSLLEREEVKYDMGKFSPPLSRTTRSRYEGPASPTPSAVPVPPSPHCKPERRKGRSPSALPRKREEGHIPRPANPFILYACSIRKKNKGQDNRLLSKMAGDTWRALPETEKKVWRDKAEDLKEKHAVDHPDYQYRPRRRDFGSPPPPPPPRKGKSVKKGAGETDFIFPTPDPEVGAAHPTMTYGRDRGHADARDDAKGEVVGDDGFGGLLYSHTYGGEVGLGTELHVADGIFPDHSNCYIPPAVNGTQHFQQHPWFTNVMDVPFSNRFAPQEISLQNLYHHSSPQIIDDTGFYNFNRPSLPSDDPYFNTHLFHPHFENSIYATTVPFQ